MDWMKTTRSGLDCWESGDWWIVGPRNGVGTFDLLNNRAWTNWQYQTLGEAMAAAKRHEPK